MRIFKPILISSIILGCMTAQQFFWSLNSGSIPLPCDATAIAGTPCIAAHSVVRKLTSSYSGPLFQVQRISDSATSNIGTTTSGLADTTSLSSFCGGAGLCRYSIIYDQMHTAVSGNNLPQATSSAQAPLDWMTLANGTIVPKLQTTSGQYYRNRTSTIGMPTGSSPTTEYMVIGTNLYSGVGTYGNMESTVADTGAGHMFALALSLYDFGSTATPPGPWAGTDWENGIYSYGSAPASAYMTILSKYSPIGPNWTLKSSQNVPTLTTLHNGSLPAGYTAHFEGGLSLGEGGDATPAPVYFQEGAITDSATSNATDNVIQSSVAKFYSGASSTFSWFYPYGTPLAWWKVCGDFSSSSGCMATSSTTVYDSSGNGNNATWSGSMEGTTAWYSQGKIGPWAGSFNASALQPVLVSGNVSLGNTFTVTAWGYNIAPSVSFNRLVESDYKTGFYLGTSSTLTYQIIINNPSIGTCTGGTVRQNAWDYVVGTYDGTNARLYVNGSLVNTCAFAAPGATSKPVYIGNGTGPKTWYGQINDVRIYNSVWSLTDIQTVYNAENR